MAHGTADAAHDVQYRSPSEEPANRKLDDFVRAQYRDLVNFLRRRTATEQDAEDAAQESLTRLLRYCDTEPYAAWKSLLYRIATNIATDQHRRAQRHHVAQHVQIDDVDVVTEASAPDDALAHKETQARIRSTILALPPKCRQVYILRLEGLSYKEIADHCGISVKMVEKHISKALAALRREAGISDRGALEES